MQAGVQLPVDNASLREYARFFMCLGRFDDAAHVLTVLAALERRDGYGPPHPRRVATLWVEVAKTAAGDSLELFDSHLREVERRFASNAFAVPQIADSTSNLADARFALKRLLDLDPTDSQAHECLIRVLIRSDLIEDAESEIERHLEGAPGTIEYLRGLVSMRRQDWDAAHAFLTAYAKQRPEDVVNVGRLDRVGLVRQLAAAEQNQLPAKPLAPENWLLDDPDRRELLLRFESIGANCEFGTVQRRYGAEPLGLFRWATTNVPSLMAALAARLEGIGDPMNTEFGVTPSGHVYLQDVRWGLPTQTFLLDHEVNLAALHPKMCRRMIYLRDKFLEDLRVAEKTLVYTGPSVALTALLGLHDAFRSFGPVRLLHVCSATACRNFPTAAPGSVTRIRPGLFLGRLSRLEEEDETLEEWIDICRGVEGLIARKKRTPTRTRSPGSPSAADDR